MLKSQAIVETFRSTAVFGDVRAQANAAGPHVSHMVAHAARRRGTVRRPRDGTGVARRRRTRRCPGRTTGAQISVPELWPADEITAKDVIDYFNGTKVVLVDKGGFQEPFPVPKASAEVIEAAIGEAVAGGKVWLLSGPASLLAEPLPAGVLLRRRRSLPRR